MYKNIVFLDGIAKNTIQSIQSFLNSWYDSNDTITVNTSGSTGQPKPIQLEKKKMLNSARATGTFFNLKSRDTLLLNLSTDFIAGKMMLLRGLVHEMKIVVADTSSNPLNHDQLDEINIDFAAFVPYQVQTILADTRTRNKYAEIKSVIIGGAPVSSTLAADIYKLPNNSYSTFGMTETISHIALKELKEGNEFYNCLPGVEVSTDQRGCLIINAPNISNEEIITNDLVDLNGVHSFKWIGRWDNVINSGGLKLIPEEIEKKIAHLFLNIRFYCIGRASEKWGEELVLKIEGKQDEFDVNQLELNLADELPAHERPKAIVFIKEFKETASGKVIRI